MPVDVADQAVDVLLEFPCETRLADACLTNNRKQANPSFRFGTVKQFLEEAQLGDPARERRLESLGSQQPAPPRHHAERAPCRNCQRFAFQGLLAGGLECNRAAGDSVGGLVDHHCAG